MVRWPSGMCRLLGLRVSNVLFATGAIALPGRSVQPESGRPLPVPVPESSRVTVPHLWWLSIAQSDLSTVLDSVDDFFPLVQYKVI